MKKNFRFYLLMLGLVIGGLIFDYLNIAGKKITTETYDTSSASLINLFSGFIFVLIAFSALWFLFRIKLTPFSSLIITLIGILLLVLPYLLIQLPYMPFEISTLLSSLRLMNTTSSFAALFWFIAGMFGLISSLRNK